MKGIFWVLFLFSIAGVAQTSETLDFKGELSHNNVTAMAQDDTGFMWLGTSNGLNRFDGLHTEVFRFTLNDSDCICGNEVLDIINDKRGNLWIATANCLNKLDLEDYSFTHYSSTSEKAISGDYVSQVELVNEHLYILSDKGLDILNLESDKVFNIELLSNVTVVDVQKFRENEILVTTSEGLFLYNFEKKKLTPFNQYNDIDYDKKGIQKAYFHDDALFLAYQDGIFEYDLKTKNKHKLYEEGLLLVRDIIKWDDIVCFCTSKGIMTYDCITENFKKPEEHAWPKGPALNTYVVSEKEVWFSILGEGVFKHSIDNPLFKTLKVDDQISESTDVNKIGHLYVDKDQILISTIQGVYSLKQNEEIQPLFETLNIEVPDNLQFVLNTTKDEKNIYVGTFDAGLFHINLMNKKVTNYSINSVGGNYIGSNTIRHALELDGENLYATDNGLFSLDHESMKMSEIMFNPSLDTNSPSKKVSVSFKDSRGILWVGTRNGLYIQDDGDKFTHLSTTTAPKLSDNWIRNITEVSDSIFLIGTSCGLNILDYNQKSIEYIGMRKGLESDVIYSVELDNDDIWISTNKGISKIDSKNQISNYNIDDGLQGGEFNANVSVKTEDGNFYFGGVNGISKFSPSKVNGAVENLEPIITGIELIENEEEFDIEMKYPLQSSYELTYLQNNFIIRFAAINYSNPENNIFYYKLDGYNKNWIRVKGESKVQIMNLKEGVYNFRVRTALRNGKLSKNEASLEIKITPPFHKTYIFKVLAAVLLLLLLFLVYIARVTAIHNRNANLKEVVEDQTKRLRDAVDMQKTFLKEIPTPLAIFNQKNEMTVVNELFSNLVKENNSGSANSENFETNLTKVLLHGVEKMRARKGNRSESEIEINDKYFNLSFSEMLVDKQEFVTVLVRDVTINKKADKILKRNEELYRSYFEKSPVGIIYAKGPMQPITKCNDQFCEMLGFDRETLLTMNMPDLTHPDDIEEDFLVIEKAYQNKSKYVYVPNKRLIGKDGNIVLTEYHVTFVFNEQGEYQYLFILIHDVTEQRANLDKLIEARTQLMQSEKLASLGQITAGVAHEINNPVNFIFNGVNNLKKLISELKTNKDGDDLEVVNQEIQQMIEAIEDGAKRTTEIVKSLRLFTREDLKTMVSYDIVGGLNSTITLLANNLREGITISQNYSSEEYFINCYPGQLNQVFMNVILNAIDAIDEIGTIEIEIVKKRKTLEVHIIDTGSGIDESIKNKIFEPFFSTKGPKHGTGLGLSISHSIMDKHKGFISFSKNSPKGTICRIVLLHDESLLEPSDTES